ncbi:Cacna1g [Symbiodinium sp. CCMP2456]|nr:Cacna1g [Symbiodinium sp. CCMP2456]
MNNLYGSFLKALYTMTFEVTHSGSWPTVVRPVLEKVDPWPRGGSLREFLGVVLERVGPAWCSFRRTSLNLDFQAKGAPGALDRAPLFEGGPGE